MNLIEFFTIYLACGAPFGVYYLMSGQRNEQYLHLRSIIVGFFWVPWVLIFSFRWVTRKLRQDEFLNNFSDKEEITALTDLKKTFETFLPGERVSTSLFELREVIERYAGLTIVRNSKQKEPAAHEKAIFKIGGNHRSEISAKCLNRRNQNRLLFHQNEARQDFLTVVEEIMRFANAEKVSTHAIKFVKLLEDEIALASLQELLTTFPQTAIDEPVKKLEKDLWKPDRPTQPKSQPVSTPLKAWTVTASSLTED